MPNEFKSIAALNFVRPDPFYEEGEDNDRKALQNEHEQFLKRLGGILSSIRGVPQTVPVPSLESRNKRLSAKNNFDPIPVRMVDD